MQVLQGFMFDFAKAPSNFFSAGIFWLQIAYYCYLYRFWCHSCRISNGSMFDFAKASICNSFCFDRGDILAVDGCIFFVTPNNPGGAFSIEVIIKSGSGTGTTGNGSGFFSTGAATATTATVSGLFIKDNLETRFNVSRLLNNSSFLKSIFLFSKTIPLYAL